MMIETEVGHALLTAMTPRLHPHIPAGGGKRGRASGGKGGLWYEEAAAAAAERAWRSASGASTSVGKSSSGGSSRSGGGGTKKRGGGGGAGQHAGKRWTRSTLESNDSSDSDMWETDSDTEELLHMFEQMVSGMRSRSRGRSSHSSGRARCGVSCRPTVSLPPPTHVATTASPRRVRAD